MSTAISQHQCWHAAVRAAASQSSLAVPSTRQLLHDPARGGLDCNHEEVPVLNGGCVSKQVAHVPAQKLMAR